MNLFYLGIFTIIACVGFFIAGFSFAVFLINKSVSREL